MVLDIDHRLWPGKTLRQEPLEDQLSWHPATFHSLDVAAVALELVRRKPVWLSRLAATVDVDGEQLGYLFVRLIALHDIGKLSRSFCEMLCHPLPVEQGDYKSASSLRHWQISYQLLIGALDEATTQFVAIKSQGARRELYAAVAGHHGEPPVLERRFKDKIGVPAALAFIEDLDRLLPPVTGIDLTEGQAKKLSWSLAGLTVASDWLGSNEDWFAYCSCETDTDQYWQSAKMAATDAVEFSHIGGAQLEGSQTFAQLFEQATPRPMQQAAIDVAIPATPSLFILEDTTGSGKTEAAIMLAHRMMSSGLGEGIYIALPTMATANAMYGRMGASYRRLFTPASMPSLVLAHGHRHLDSAFRDAVHAGLMEYQQVENTGLATEESNTASAFCATWISDNKRKTFLAEIGVGTIDQAFMAVLPVRHAVLRLFGLGQRILIIDEAHACDPYMESELCQLLKMQAALGGSAIVMTATLTNSLRAKLADNYQAGLITAKTDENISNHYPLLTVVSQDQVHSIPVEVTEQGRRQLPVKRVDSIDDAVVLVMEAAAQGAAVAWIRNTVDDAIAAYHAVKELGGDVQIFHARFTMHDRLVIENHVVSQFGMHGNVESRRGKILIATQVIEQSLDLDFDFLLTDLAPVDALIQRAGRLWRHMHVRPAHSRPVAQAVLHVLSADPHDVQDASWGRGQTGASEYVYGTSLLWKTATALFGANVIDSPDGLRPLLDAVVGDSQPDVPPVLEKDNNELIGNAYALQARGTDNAVKPLQGYFASKPRSNEERFPTRADMASIRVLMIRVVDTKVCTWVDSEQDADGTLSEISLRPGFLKILEEGGGAPTDGLVPDCVAQWPEWRRDLLKMLVVSDDGAVGASGRYNSLVGLSRNPDTSG